ncbi:MAG: MFS transporter, partial [Candidatus Competibacterales bacterium]
MSLGFFRFLHRAAPALGLGFVLAFGSSIGQTYFISLFAGELRAELNLSHGAFGGLYTLATVASAATLVWLGKLADRFSLVALSLVTLGALVAFALVMAQVETLLGLGLALYGLRLGGQGMMSHLAITAMGRWFVRERGRALSVATLGFPAGEALLPGLVAVLLGTMAWRSVWVTMAIVLGGVLLPTVWWLGRVVHRRHLDRPQRLSTAADAPEVTPWTRRQVLRDGRFYALLPGLLAPPFIITGVLFHQVHLVTLKGWSLAGFAACYPLYAGCATAVALGLGGLVDRLGAIRLLGFYLLPLAMGWTLGAVRAAPETAAVCMGV